MLVYDGLVVNSTGMTYENVEQVVLSEVNDRKISFGKEQGSTITQWIGCGYKAMFLLQELARLGAGSKPNLEPLMDMIQDITVPKASDLETLQSWRECGLKAMFLLKELSRLGAENVTELKPIMDMVNGITVPMTSERDKEMAGLHSVYSNIG
jgi:hypothetical protein